MARPFKSLQSEICYGADIKGTGEVAKDNMADNSEENFRTVGASYPQYPKVTLVDSSFIN